MDVLPANGYLTEIEPNIAHENTITEALEIILTYLPTDAS